MIAGYFSLPTYQFVNAANPSARPGGHFYLMENLL